jgi:hypothetical protein
MFIIWFGSSLNLQLLLVLGKPRIKYINPSVQITKLINATSFTHKTLTGTLIIGSKDFAPQSGTYIYLCIFRGKMLLEARRGGLAHASYDQFHS